MDTLTLTRLLVAHESPSGNEHKLASEISTWLKNHTACQVERVGASVIAFLPGRNQDACIILNGHIDTVAAGARDLWQTDPLAATLKNDKLYGLGASDMKGAVAAMLLLMNEQTPPCDLYAMFVAEEETTGAGTEAALDHIAPKLKEYQHVAGIIGEPTNLGVALAHRGNAFVRVTFTGEGGHGSRPPEMSRQAIMKAHQFVGSIAAKQEEWAAVHHDALLGVPTVAVTQLSAGEDTSKNQIPTQSSVLLDIRTVPSFHEKLPSEITAWAKTYDGTAEIISPNPTGYCAPTEPIAKVAMELAEQTEPAVSPGSTDQCAFTARGIPAIICGPGTREVIHAPNEYIEKELLVRTPEHYRKIIEAWSCRILE